MTTVTETSPLTRAAPELAGLQHIGLTVRDIVASEAWYTKVLGLVRAFVEPHSTGDGHAVVMTRPGTGLFVGLEHHPDADKERFSPLRTGLDHLAVQVPSREALDGWIARLEAMGVEHEAVVERNEPVRLALVLVRDPDSIPIELICWPGRGPGRESLMTSRSPGRTRARSGPETCARLVRVRLRGGSRLVTHESPRPEQTTLIETERTTMSIHVVEPNGGEQSGGGPIRCRIIEDGSHTEHRLGLVEATVPVGPATPPQHVHREHDETFIVTQGRLRFTSGNDSVDVEAGSCVVVPARTPHTFSNPFSHPARFICTVTPDRYVEYFRDLSRLPVDEQGFLDPADIGRTMAKYATDVMG